MLPNCPFEAIEADTKTEFSYQGGVDRPEGKPILRPSAKTVRILFFNFLPRGGFFYREK